MQTETAEGRGNCLAACVASILETPLSDVPNFRLAPDPWQALQQWLAPRGLCALKVRVAPGCLYPVSGVHCILIGDSPRRNVLHAVVGQIDGCDWKMVHDPHPEGGWLKGEVQWVTFFGKLV